MCQEIHNQKNVHLMIVHTSKQNVWNQCNSNRFSWLIFNDRKDTTYIVAQMDQVTFENLSFCLCWRYRIEISSKMLSYSEHLFKECCSVVGQLWKTLFIKCFPCWATHFCICMSWCSTLPNQACQSESLMVQGLLV